MRSAKRTGQTIGLLILAQVTAGPIVNFGLLRPITTPGFLANAVGSSLQLGVAVVVLFVTGALSIGIAVTAWPVFREYSPRMALSLLSLGVASFSVAAVENCSVMSMLSLSQAYAAADTADPGVFEALGVVVRAARRWAHVTNLLVGGGMIFIFYSILYRFALVPRALSAFGLAAALLHIAAVTMAFLGPYVFPLMIPLGVSYLAIALWLMAKGFDEGPHAPRPGAEGGAGLSGA